jgi:hypothetical protein
VQIDHAIALVLSLDESQKNAFEMKFESHKNIVNTSNQMPAALNFYAWLNSKKSNLNIISTRYHWYCFKNV